ncbi:Carnosine N-methyltransferase [Paramyrothecium foliicola]|nr:Carnosine N-methyltransferase [Paramyrothecium foliicola]
MSGHDISTMTIDPAPMDRDGDEAGLPVAADESTWGGVEDSMEDPEEVRVIFCALDSFSQYAKVAHFNVTHLRRQSFYALPQAQWQLLAGPPFNFLDTLEKTDEAIDSNAELARAILTTGLRTFRTIAPEPGQDESAMPHQWAGVAKHSDIDKARSTIRQFYRDWTADGAAERAASYGPIMEVMEEERAKAPERAPLKVLVPGAGLGRLVFDLCQKGFDAEGNEISYHQLLASSYILNQCEAAGKHTIHPWVHTFSNHLTRENHLRGYPVPDIHPATVLANTPNAGPMSMCAADFLCLYGDDAHKDTYDAVASVFFLDTAPNLIRYLGVIYHCLRPGGVLINVGPLLWHFENNAPGNHGRDDDGDGEHDYNNSSGIADPGSFELTDDEVMALVQNLGFELEWRRTGIEAPYIQDKDSMLSTIYKANAWVARKPLVQNDLSLNIKTTYARASSQLGFLGARQLALDPHGTAVDGNGLAVDVRARAAGKVDDGARNVLGLAEAAHGVRLADLVGAARDLEQAVGHLAGEEARADGVDGDVAGAELDGEVAAQVDDGGLAGRVAVGALGAEGADAEAGDAGGDDDARGVLRRGGLLEQGREDADGVEDGLYVEVHDLGKGRVRVRVERLAPRGAGVGEEDVDAVRVLLDLGEEVLDALERRRVGRHGDGDGAGGAVRQGVEGLAGLVAGGGLARRDEDLGGAGLEEAGNPGNSRSAVISPRLSTEEQKNKAREEERGREGGLRRCSVQAEASRAACDDGHLALKGEERGEVVELCLCHFESAVEEIGGRMQEGMRRKATLIEAGERRSRRARLVVVVCR